jgi:hypothetical protein
MGSIKVGFSHKTWYVSLNAGEMSLYKFEAKSQVLVRHCPCNGRMSYMEQNQHSKSADLHE